MGSETAHPEAPRDYEDGTAAIQPVTDAMMDHAAHEAAALVEKAVHGEPGTHGVTGPAAARDADAPADDVPAPPDPAASADRVDAGPTAATTDLGRYGAKVIEAMRTNAAATGAHLAALVQARSIPEAMSLNADHIRRQFDAMTAQGRELAILAQEATLDAFKPFWDAMKRDR